MQIIPAKTQEHFETIEKLSWEILPPVYTPYVHRDHVTYFIEKYLSVEALIEFAAEDYDYYLLNYENNTAGFLGLRKNEDSLTLSKLYILPEYRGKKIGKNALEFTERYARENEYTKIDLQVNKYNADSIAIYTKAGYAIHELQTNCFENGHSVQDYVMVKNI